MCWKCSKVTNEEKEKTEEIEGLYWACDKCVGNIKDFKRNGAQLLKKTLEKLTEEKKEMQDKLKQEISETKIEEIKEIAKKLLEDEMENKEKRYNGLKRASENKEVILDEMKFESQAVHCINAFLTIVNTTLGIMYSVCIYSWWWDVHICIYFVNSVVFVAFLIKSSFQKRHGKSKLRAEN